VALTPSTTLVHLPFAQRVEYGQPYPEGIAVGHIDQTGDVSGDPITASFLAQDQFLYRLELVQSTHNSEATSDTSVQLIAGWANEQSGFGTGAFSLNWQMPVKNGGGFAAHSLASGDLLAARRFPLGDVRPGAGQFIAVITSADNINANVFDYDVVFSYWPKTALYLPGFLSSFWEAPEVAPPAL